MRRRRNPVLRVLPSAAALLLRLSAGILPAGCPSAAGLLVFLPERECVLPLRAAMSRGLAAGRAGAAVMSPKLLAVVLLLVARPLSAETYKWVDEKGVTNYSSSPPANAKLAEKTQVVEERLSVYTPDPGLLRATQVRPSMSAPMPHTDRKSTRLNSSHGYISYAVFCLKKKK